MLRSSRRGADYRYYDVPDCGDMIGIRALRQLGFSIQDIHRLLNDSTKSDIVAHLSRKIEDNRRKIKELENAEKMLKRYLGWSALVAERPNQWFLAESPDYYFLKHTSGTDFQRPSASKDFIKEWMDRLPSTLMSLLIPLEKKDSERGEDCYWGFSIEEDLAREEGLTIEEPVRLVHLGRCFAYVYSRKVEKYGTPAMLREPLRIMRAEGLSPADDILCIYVSEANDDEEETRLENYIVMIPIK